MPVFALSQSRPLRYFTFGYLYLAQGVPAGFALTAIANYLTAEGVSAGSVGTFVAAVGLPWAFQFAWGPFIDRFQNSPMGRRKPWVLAAQLLAWLASLGLLLIDQPFSQLPLLAGAFFVHSLFASLQDASVDALAITIVPETERGRLNAVMRAGFLLGTGLGAALLSWLLGTQGFQAAAMMQSLFLLLTTALTVFIKEKGGDALFPWSARPPGPLPSSTVGIPQLFGQLWQGLLAGRSLLLFVPILLVYLSQSVFIRAYSVHLIKELHWADMRLSVLSGTFGTGVVLAVVLLGGWLADRMGARRLLWRVMLGNGLYLLALSLLSPWWNQPGVASTGLTLYYLLDPALSVVAMPVLMALCRPQVAGSQFTAYMALVNLSDVAGSYLSGQVQPYLGTPVMGLMCGGVILVALTCAWPAIVGSQP